MLSFGYRYVPYRPKAFSYIFLSILKTKVCELSKPHPHHTQSINSFAEVSIHETIREEKNPHLLKLSLQGLSTSVEGFESCHPKLVGIVADISCSV